MLLPFMLRISCKGGAPVGCAIIDSQSWCTAFGFGPSGWYWRWKKSLSCWAMVGGVGDEVRERKDTALRWAVRKMGLRRDRWYPRWVRHWRNSFDFIEMSCG